MKKPRIDKERIKEKLNSIVEFFFPSNVVCIGCGKDLFIANDRYALCPDCARKLYQIETCCPRCGKSNRYGEVCNICSTTKLYFEKNYSCLVYDGLIREIVHAYKFNGRSYLYRYLSSFMVDKIIAEDVEVDLMTAVPVSKERFRERGYNQAELLAKEIAKRMNIPYSNQIFKKEGHSVQVGKNWAERKKNVENTFFVKNKDAFSGKTVLVVDDIITTGSTMNSVAKTLSEAGAKRVFGLTLCGVRFSDDPNAPIS